MHDDGWINEPIGMSNFLSFELIYHIMNYVKDKNATNKQIVYSAIRGSTDRRRRGSQTINRDNITKTLSQNNIKNRCLVKRVLRSYCSSKFVISPKYGIDYPERGRLYI